MKNTLRSIFMLSSLLSVYSSQAQNAFPSSGNVGIGTTAPGAALSFINLDQTTQPTGITWLSHLPTVYGIHRTAGAWDPPNFQQLRMSWETGIILDPGTAYGKSYVDVAGKGLRVTSGNVGIGTTTPGAALSFTDMYQTTQPVGLSWYGPIPTLYGIHRTAGPWSYPDYQQLRMSWETGIILDPGSAYGKSYVDIGGKGLRVTSGNVGIGTTTPLNKLEVQLTGTGGISLGAFNLPATPGVMRFIGTTGVDGTFNGGNIIGGDNASSGMAIINTSAGNPVFGTSQDVAFYTHHAGAQSNQKMIIKSDGNVGIGTTDTKGYRLAVNGSAIFTSVKVKQFNAWPDYVFDADYSLLPLSDVAAYIKTNKHLPDVVSAQEVKKEGIDLGGNQAVLLRKIEELTLYLIDLDKKVTCLQQENAALQTTRLNSQKQ